MFRNLNDFIQNWELEAASTQRVLDNLSQESLSQKVAENHRSLGELAWHLVEAVPHMMTSIGLKLEHAERQNNEELSVKEISDGYRQMTKGFQNAVKEEWNDEKMTSMVDFFGQKLPLGAVLLVLLQHQTHHRGQMTVLMRQAGLTVPGLYGPSQEEWEQM
jgi:uncharacterized damage-inducible protein DinB